MLGKRVEFHRFSQQLECMWNADLLLFDTVEKLKIDERIYLCYTVRERSEICNSHENSGHASPRIPHNKATKPA